MEKAVKMNKVRTSKKVSKLGAWIDSHKGGIVIVVDRKAVNK